MMAGPSNDKCSRSVVCSEDPPPLSITLKKTRDLPRKTTDWSIDHLPVDILLLTVEDCGFLACYHYLRHPFKSYEKSIGFVYFGKMGEDEDEDEGGSVKVAIVRCRKESSDPGGSQTATKNAVTLLKPKATFLVGFCYSLNLNKAQLGDVVISSKLTTDFHKTSVSRDVGNLVRSAADGWEAPLENPEAREVKVHSDGEIFSCSNLIDTEQQCQSHPGAIAVDMEGKGLFAVAHDMKVEWIVVKGVCGLVQGVTSTNNSWKTFACVMAASVVSNMLSNSFVFKDWPHYGDGELKIKVDVDHLKPEEQNKQTGMLATESDRYQEVQQPRVSATSAASGDVSCPKTEDLLAIKEEFFLSIVRKYFNATELHSMEEFEKFLEYATLMRFAIIGVSRGSLVITVKCESLMDLEKLQADYLSGHLGEMVQNCFVTEQILKELNLAELRLKTTMDIEEYNACKMFFEKNAVREFHPTSSTSEGLQKKEQWGKSDQKTKVMETAKSEDTTPHTVVPTTGHGRELEQSRGRTDTVPLLVSPTSDPEEELEPGELRMELPRMKGGSPKHFHRSKVKRRDEVSSPGNALTRKKRKTRLAGGSTKHFRWPKVKRRDEESCPSRALTPKKRKTRLAGGSTKHFRWPKMKRRDEESSPSDVLTPKERKTRLAGGSTKHFRWRKVKRRDEESSPSDTLTPKIKKTRLAGSSTKHLRPPKVEGCNEESSPSDVLTPKKKKTRLAGGSTKHLRPPEVEGRNEESSPNDALAPNKKKTRLAGGTTKHFGWPKANRRDEESSPSDALTLKKRKTRLAGSSTKHFRRSKVKRRDKESSPSDALTPKKRKTRLAGGSTKHLRPPKVKRLDEESSPSDALTPKIRKTRLAGGSTEDLHRSKAEHRNEESSPSDAFTPKKKKTRLAVNQGVCDEESSPSDAFTPKKRKTRLAGGSTKHLHWPKAERRNKESSPGDAFTPKDKKNRLSGGSTKRLHRPKAERPNEESSARDALTSKKKKTRLAVKQGVPSDEDLEWLSQELEEWKTVGRRLKIKEAKLTAFDIEKRKCSEKIYKMLLHWKSRDSSTATYTILRNALCHPWVNRTDLAEQLITDISTGEEGCKSGDPSGNEHRRLAEPLNVEKCQEKLKSYYDTFSKVKIVPWDESSSIQIDEIYTPLNWMRDHRKPRGVTQEELEDYTDMFKGKHTRMLVYGRPGIGKSTFCKKAAYDWSKALKEILKNFSILLLIKLKDVCHVGNIRDVLLASKLLASDGPISVDSLYEYIINNQDEVLLILDGYDEYCCAKEHSPILAIWKGEQLRDCHVIVTTRQIKRDELRGPSHVQLEIHGFKSRERRETFARKFLAGEQDLDEFMSYLDYNHLHDMAVIPLLLLMLCILWKEKHHEGLPKSRADIFIQFIQIMLYHKGESQQPMPFQKVTSAEAREDLSNLGKAAFEALLQDRLYVRCSELPGNISRSFEKLSEVGLFQIVNVTSPNPEKGAYFIHKSLQEFLAAWHIKEEVLSVKGESTPSLSKVESFEKIKKMNEVLKFVCELSTEAACAVFHHVGCVGRKESLSECDFIKWLLSEGEKLYSSDRKLYLELISHSYFCCSAEKRRDLCSVFSSYTGGVLSLDSNQLNITANEHLLKSGMIPDAIFFPSFEDSSEKSYRDLITVAEDTDAVFLSCSGEKKAADFLKKFPRRPLREFFLKRERKIIVYVYEIQNLSGSLPTEMLRELISPTTEYTQMKRVGDPLNEHDSGTASYLTKNTNSIIGSTPHSLSCLSRINIFDIERQEMKMVADFLPLFTALQDILIFGKPSEIIYDQLTETLVSRIIFTDRLHTLELVYIDLTAKPAEAIARSLHRVPNLCHLNLTGNPLGKGVTVLTQHLSHVPHLEGLYLVDVKMTKQQVNDLSAAVRQSNISVIHSDYHDDEGNVKPEEEWLTDEYWGDYWSESE